MDKLSDIWHCALTVHRLLVDEEGTTNKSNQQTRQPNVPRKSFDIKAMVVLKETVPSNLDRFQAATRPLLTWEESGVFCNAQAQRLRGEENNKINSK
jgi:hypothetical protein